MEPSWIVLSLLLLSVVLFSTERVSVDLVTWGMLVVLIGVGILTPKEAFAGFGDEILVVLGSIYVISTALKETKLLDYFGEKLYRVLGTWGRRAFVPLTMGGVGMVSAVMNNTTCTALFLGPIMGLCRKMQVSPSKVLMPLAFASILGGTCTLVGTSTNMAVSAYLKKNGIAEIGMFETLGFGCLVLVTGIVYIAVLGKHLLPDRPDTSLLEEYGLPEFLAEVVVLEDSPLVGQAVFDSDLTILDFRVLKIVREEADVIPTQNLRIHAGDLVLVSGRISNLMKVRKIEGIEIRGDAKSSAEMLGKGPLRMAEVVVGTRSTVVNRTIREADIRKRHGLQVLAVHRAGHQLDKALAEIRLHGGDVLLVQAPADTLERLDRGSDFALLADEETTPKVRRRGFVILAAFLASIGISAFTPVPASILLLSTAILAVQLRAVDLEAAYRSIDWKLLFLIGGMMAFGTAMHKTGSDTMLARAVCAMAEPFGPMGVLTGMVILTVLLTQPMSNAAAAMVVLPVALEAAELAGISARTMGISVMLAASISVFTPFEPSCLLVYGPGRYRFVDFLKTGGGLTVIAVGLLLVMVPLVWGLRP